MLKVTGSARLRADRWPAARRGRSAWWAVLPLAAAGLGALAVERPIVAVALTLGLVFVWATFSNLAAGLALFTVLTFFERFPGLDASGLTLIKLAGGLLAGAWLLAIAPRQRAAPLLVRAQPVLGYVAIAYTAWGFLSIAWAEDPELALSSAFRTFQGVVLAFIAYSALSQSRHLEWLTLAFTFGAFLTAVVGLAGATQPEAPDAFGAARITGGIGDANELAAILIPALALAVFSLPAVQSALVRWLLVFFAATYAVALFRTESRGGLVGLGAMLLAGVLFAGPVRPRVVAAALVVAALGVFYYTLVAPPESLQRISDFSSAGSTGRTDLWRVAVEVSNDHPLAGVGAGNFTAVEPLYAPRTIDLQRADLVVDATKVVHNTYLQVLADLGWVGLVLFGGFVLGCLLRAHEAARLCARRGEVQLEVLSRGLLVGAVGMLAAFTFLSAEHEKQLWLLLGVAAALRSVAQARNDRR